MEITGSKPLAFARPVSESQYVVVVPYHAGTRVKAHEIGHAVLRHNLSPGTKPRITVLKARPKQFDLISSNLVSEDKPVPRTIGQSLRNELDADIFSYEKTGRQYSLRSALDVGSIAVGYYKLRPSEAFSLITKHLVSKGYRLTKKQESELWHSLIRYSRVRR